jgi:hypothetical protein
MSRGFSGDVDRRDRRERIDHLREMHGGRAADAILARPAASRKAGDES